MDRDKAERRLRDLEAAYVLGQQALKERNQLIIDMVNDGVRQADVFRLLNETRAEVGGEPITRDAVFMLVYRNRKK